MYRIFRMSKVKPDYDNMIIIWYHNMHHPLIRNILTFGYNIHHPHSDPRRQARKNQHRG